jgi:putative phage-type endonuclease
MAIKSSSPLITPCADRDAWLALRHTGIGSSDAAAIVGASPWKSPFTVFCEKLGLDDAEDQRAALEALEWGLALEIPIAARYARETGRSLRAPAPYELLRSAAHPFMVATLDREILDADRGPGVLEIKTAGWMKRDEWVDEPPLAYQIQVQHALAVSGARWGSLAVLIGGQKFRWCDVERNDAFIEALVEIEATFWACIERREPPSPDDTRACRELLKRLFPQHVPGKTVALPPEADAWDQALCAAKQDLEDAEARKRLAESHLIAALGDAECGLLPSGAQYTFKATPRKAYAVKATTVRTLRRVTT